VIEADGSGEKTFDFPIPGQVAWAAGPVFPDRHRIILTSYADTTISKIVTGETTTRLWIYDFSTADLQEILIQDRLASFLGCVGILNEKPGLEKLLVTALIEGENRLFISNLDGSDPFELTQEGEGFVYGIHLSPDRKQVSFHITGSKKADRQHLHPFRPGPYAINVISIDSTRRTLVAGQPGHLYFDPVWSPDGAWLAYLDCFEEQDKAHFASDLSLGKPDGSLHRVVTQDQSHWFGTSFGTAANRGGGSNTTRWSPDGQTLLYTRLLPGSHPDCTYDPSRPDHEELVYAPKLARGGTQLCTLNPFTGQVVELTAAEEGKWEHHACYTPDGSQIVYGKAWVGQDTELWIMDRDGRNQRLLTRGVEKKGAAVVEATSLRIRIPKNSS
jgi:TolB protein